MIVLLHRQRHAPGSDASVPVRYALKLPQNGTLADVKHTLSRLCGIRAENMLFADVYDGRLCEIYGNNKSLTSIGTEDVLKAYEIDQGVPSIFAFVSHMLDVPERFDTHYIGFSFMVSEN